MRAEATAARLGLGFPQRALTAEYPQCVRGGPVLGLVFLLMFGYSILLWLVLR